MHVAANDILVSLTNKLISRDLYMQCLYNDWKSSYTLTLIVHVTQFVVNVLSVSLSCLSCGSHASKKLLSYTITTVLPLDSDYIPATSHLPLCDTLTSSSSSLRATPTVTLVTSDDNEPSISSGVIGLGSVSTILILGLVIALATLVILFLVIRHRQKRRKRKNTINDLSRNDEDVGDIALSQVQVQVNNRGIIRRSFSQTASRSVALSTSIFRSRVVSLHSISLTTAFL